MRQLGRRRPAGEALQQNFAENLRILCAFFPSVAHVCRALQVNRTQFNRYLGATSRPSTHILTRICDFFGVDAAEVHLPPAEFARLINAPRRPRGQLPPHLARFEELIRPGALHLAKYLGYYHAYYHSMSAQGSIIRGVVHLFEHQDVVYYRWIEHGVPSDPGTPPPRWRYAGAALHLGDRIFLVGSETLNNTEITEAILYPTHKNRVGRLTGLLIGVSSANRRDIVCSRLVFDWLGTEIDLRRALRACGIFPPDPGLVPRSVLQAIGSQTPSAAILTASTN
ncbi:XRE family transcriptional regulator [Prosthecomicrobium sp. N25]|uniref:XRE family transcriptional regulator n=1 Tax=Prosthecomicrobium sp. N25 TaxID=3129254 RepID=UPI0030782F70